MEESYGYDVETIDANDVGSVDDLIDEALKERGSYCNTCNTD